MEPDLVAIRTQLRDVRRQARDGLNAGLVKMQHECRELVHKVQRLSPEEVKPIDVCEIQGAVVSLGGAIDAVIDAIQAGTFREYGGPEAIIDDLIASGREPTAEELTTLRRATGESP
jgi:hypothetical protein